MFRNWTNMSSTLENDAWGMRAVVALHHFGNISDCGSIDHIFHLHGKDMATLIASISYTYFLHISGKMASNHILQYSAENMLYCKMYSAPPSIGNRHTMHLTSDKLIDFPFSKTPQIVSSTKVGQNICAWFCFPIPGREGITFMSQDDMSAPSSRMFHPGLRNFIPES